MAKRKPDVIITKTIQSMSRMPNSTNGNPRYRFQFTDGSIAATEPDTGMAYEVWSGWEGKTFVFTVNGRGNIWKAEEVADPEQHPTEEFNQ